MTLHGRSVAWSLSVLMILAVMSGCGGTHTPCPHPRYGGTSEIEVSPSPEVVGALSLTYQTESGTAVSTATQLTPTGTNFVGSQILHVPITGIRQAELAFSIPAGSATQLASDFDVTVFLPMGVQELLTTTGEETTLTGPEASYQVQLGHPGLDVFLGPPIDQIRVDLKKSDGSVSTISVLIDYIGQNSEKEGVDYE